MRTGIEIFEAILSFLHRKLKSRQISAIILIASLLLGGLCVYMGFATINPPHDEEDVWIYDGRENLHAVLYKPKNIERAPAVLVIHGFMASIGYMRYISMDLVEQGYVVLAVDLPGHGLSEGLFTINFTELGLRLRNVVKWLKEREFVNSTKIAVVGHSVGGGCSIVVGAMYNLTAVVALGPVPVLEFVNKTAPHNLLLIAGKYDDVVYPSAVESIAKKAVGSDVIMPNILYGSFENGSARMFYIDEDAIHHSEQIDPEIRQLTVNWLRLSFGEGMAHEIYGTPLFFIVGGALFIVAVLSLIILLRPRAQIATDKSAEYENLRKKVLFFIGFWISGGILAAIIIGCGFLIALEFKLPMLIFLAPSLLLGLGIGGELAHKFVYGSGYLLKNLRKDIRLSDIARGIIVAVTAYLLLFCYVLVPIITEQLSITRAIYAFICALLIIPTLVVMETTARKIKEILAIHFRSVAVEIIMLTLILVIPIGGPLVLIFLMRITSAGILTVMISALMALYFAIAVTARRLGYSLVFSPVAISLLLGAIMITFSPFIDPSALTDIKTLIEFVESISGRKFPELLP